MLKIENKTIKSILKQYQQIWALGHAESLMGWDLEIYMPDAGLEERGCAEGELAKISQKLMLKRSFRNNIKKAEKQTLNITEKGIIRVLKRDIDVLENLPPSFVQKFSKLTVKSRTSWRDARKQNNFKKFQPYLQKITDLSIKKAEYINNNKKPYDVLLDLYEEGLTIKEMDKVFDGIRNPLQLLLKKVQNSKKFLEKHPLQDEKYEKAKMEKLNHEILKKFRFDLTKGRLDISTHPFTQDMGVNDVRITTRYEGKDFSNTISSTIHEFGHALYEMQVSQELAKTPVAGGVSMGVHESQSRFWENIIGRNKTFVEKNYDLFKKYLSFLTKYRKEDVYRYFNNITPSLIRVEADEATYNFHIMLRYEIERDLITGKIDVKDLPEIWKAKMQDYLGIIPKTDTEGVLQDIHWSMGSIGYFPTYTLGTVLACQIQHKMEEKIGRIKDLISKEKYEDVKTWLKENIHKYGSIYSPQNLIKKALGEGINTTYFINHIKNKIKELY